MAGYCILRYGTLAERPATADPWVLWFVTDSGQQRFTQYSGSAWIDLQGSAARVDLGSSSGLVATVPVPMSSMSSPVKSTIDGITAAGGDSAAYHAASDFATPTTLTAAIARTVVEINVGNTPRLSGSFTISGSGFTPGKAVTIQQTAGPYTGKSPIGDDSEWDGLLVTAICKDANTIQAYWASATGLVSGNYKFSYRA